LQFAAGDFRNYATIRSAMSQVGANVVIKLDSTDAITLVNVSLSNMVSTDFKFGGNALTAGATLLGQYAAGFGRVHDSGTTAANTYASPTAPNLVLSAQR
jgi:hypothetical protein